MKQLLQNSKSGEFSIPEIPVPACLPDGVLVKTAYSLISAGTEKNSVSTAKASMVGKAKSRPDLVAKVLNQIKKQGLVETIKLVKDRLDAPLQLGYSCAGIVIEIGENVRDIKIGDAVACAGGGYASHAEVNYIPQNLVVPLPASISLKDAAYGTLGAIAMQGVRQANVSVGESVAVIGLGLLGQLTAQILQAAGCRVIGIDISDFAIEKATFKSKNKNGTSTPITAESFVAVNAGKQEVESVVSSFTKGHGVDHVIVTAATKDNGPLLQAGAICRDKGTIVVVGAVPVNIPRSPFYEKEIEIKFSRSYGPGRYDANYEEKGRDYPFAYVRWTEQRNIESFIQLVAQGKIDLTHITTHTFSLEKAPDAYSMILERSEAFLGILLDYGLDAQKEIQLNRSMTKSERSKTGKINLSFIGLGKFAQSFLMPAIKKDTDVALNHVVNSTGVSANIAMEKNGFAKCGSEANAIFEDASCNTVFIASRHNSHAEFALQAITSGKHTFVEKPLCITTEELDEIENAFQSRKDPSKTLMIGYNRRFAPLSQELARELQNHSRPITVYYRVNTGMLPADHWTNDPEIGGGRILGEACHFIDYALFLTKSKITSVHAVAARYNQADILDANTVSINLGFANGSVATVHYFCDGDRGVPKEWIEVMGDGRTYQLDDFRVGTKFADGKKSKFKSSGTQNKGHANEVNAYLQTLKTGKEALISAEALFHGMRATFAVLDSIRTGNVIKL